MGERKRDGVHYKDIYVRTLENLIIMNSQVKHFVPFIPMTYSTRLVQSISPARPPDRSRWFFARVPRASFPISSPEKLASMKVCRILSPFSARARARVEAFN